MQNDLHLAPVGALGPPFVFAKQTERGFTLDPATDRDSKATWEIVYSPGPRLPSRNVYTPHKSVLSKILKAI